MKLTHFRIIYKNGNCTLTTENRTHTTDAIPSIKMVTNALHTICLDHNINDFSQAKAELYCNGGYVCTYRLPIGNN